MKINGTTKPLMAILDITYLSEPHTGSMDCRFCSYKYIGVIHHFENTVDTIGT